MKLPEEIQNGLRTGRLGVSQGYIFAVHLDHPNLMDIYYEAIDELGFTNAELEKVLKRSRKPPTEQGTRKRPFSLYRKSVQSVRQFFPLRNEPHRHR